MTRAPVPLPTRATSRMMKTADPSEESLTLRILPRINEVPREAWDALAEADPESTPFVEWTWLDCLEEAGCVGEKAGWIPYHFTLWRPDQAGQERLIAAAPAYLKLNSEGEFVFDWGWADLADRLRIAYYPKLVFAVPFTPATGERVLVAAGEDRAAITRAFARAAREVAVANNLSSTHALFVREPELQAWKAAGYQARFGVQFHWKNNDYQSWEDFLATFSSKRRNQIKRERAQPARDGVHIETVPPEKLTRETADTMHALYAVTVDKFHWGRRYLNKKFFRLLVERFASRLAWVQATRDGEVIAGAFNIQKGKRLYGRYWGGLVELPFLHFNVCYYHGIAQCIEEGLHVFEPGAGGEHKRVRGFMPTVTYSAHHLEDPRLARAVGAFLDRERASISAHVADEAGEETARAERQAAAREPTDPPPT